MYRRFKRTLIATLSGLAIALALTVLPNVVNPATALTAAPPAKECHDSDQLTGTEGQLNWNFKDSWVNYISNKGFDAHWNTFYGASFHKADAVKDEYWSFPAKNVTYNPKTKQGEAEYTGMVHFYSHPWPGEKGKYLLDMTWSDPIVTFKDGAGTISMLVTSRNLTTFEIVDYKRLTVARFTGLSYDAKAGSLSAKKVLFDDEVSKGDAGKAFNNEYKDGLELSGFTSPVKLAPKQVCVEKPSPKPEKPGTTTPKKPGLDDQGDKGKPVEPKEPSTPSCTVSRTHFVGNTGSLAWGFKESWQHYISMKSFDAHWQLSDGAGWDAAKKQWIWKVKQSDFNLPTHELKIQYQGTVHFLSHPAGDGSYLLDMKWINPIYVFSMKDNTAKIQMHVISRDENTKKYVDFGVIDFAQIGQQKVSHGQDESNFNFSLEATKVWLTEAGAKVFGAYKKGQELLPFQTTAPLAPEMHGDGCQPVKQPTMPDNPKEDKEPQPTPQQPAENPAPAPNPAPQLQQPQQPQPQQPAVKQCKVDPNLMRVTGGALNWGIRSSFTTYIRGLAKGSWDTSDGVRWNGSAFVFPAGYGTYNKATRTGTINYRGLIHFTGHQGVLNLKLWNPSLVINGNSATLYMSGSSTNMDGKAVPVGRVAFATMHLDRVSVSGNQLSFSASNTYLTAEGTKAFAGFYKVGERLDGLNSAVTLAQATSCDSQGNLLYLGADGKYHKGGLASTGIELGSLLALTLTLAAAGSITIAARRRTKNSVA